MPRRRRHSSSERIDRSEKAGGAGKRESGEGERGEARGGSSSVAEPTALSAAAGTSGGVKRREQPENVYEGTRLVTFSSWPTAPPGFLLASGIKALTCTTVKVGGV